MALSGDVPSGIVERQGNPALVLPAVLRELYSGRRTGLLYVEHEPDRVSFRFVNGEVVSGSSSSERGRLGETMVRYGLLARPDLDRALDVVNKEGRRLGPVLRELGVIEAPRLEQALDLHIREMLLTALGWEEAFHVFEQEELPERTREDLTLRSSTGELILELVRRISSLETVRQGLGHIDQILVPVADPPFRLERITLTPADGYVLSRVDGKATARTIIEITPLPKEEVERSLLGLLCTGVVEYRPLSSSPAEIGAEAARARAATLSPPAVPSAREASAEIRRIVEEAYAGVRTKDHFQVLGLLRTASVSDVKEAYARQLKRLRPEMLPGCPPELGSKMQAVLARLRDAHQALSTPEGRDQYEASLRSAPPSPSPRENGLASHDPSATLAPGYSQGPPRVAADAEALAQAVAAAEADLDRGRFREALVALESIIPMAHGNLERRARLLRARGYQMSPEDARKAESDFLQLVRLDPKDTEALFALGKFYVAKSLPSRARAMFQKVVELKPDHKAAAAELASLRASAPGSEGLLNRLRRQTG